MKLVNESTQQFTPVSEFKQGQIGIIRKWGAGEFGKRYIGTLVMKYHEGIVSLEDGDTWLDNIHRPDDEFQVELLPNGTKLQIINNPETK